MESGIGSGNRSSSAEIDLDHCSEFSKVDLEEVLTPTPLLLGAAINILLAISATLLNSVVFVAVRRSCALHWPSKLLLLSLIVTDVGTGAITQPVFTALLLSKASNMPHRTCVLLWMCYYVFSLFSSASLIMMAAISFDRYAALFHHLKYREIVTAKTVGVFLAASWATSAFYASALGWNKTLHVYATLCGISSLLFLTAVAYIRIYRGLRHHHGVKVHVQRSGQAAPGRTSLNIAKYRRSASSMMWVYGLFLLCYLPHLCTFVVIQHIPQNFLTMCISDFLSTLIFLNSSLNPIVYCYRLPGIRSEVLRIIKKILPFKRPRLL